MIQTDKFPDRVIATPYGKVSFDEKGQSNDLTKEQQEKLGDLAYVEYVEDKKPEPKKEEPKQEAKKEEKPKAETKKKTTAKKTTKRKDKE